MPVKHIAHARRGGGGGSFPNVLSGFREGSVSRSATMAAFFVARLTCSLVSNKLLMTSATIPLLAALDAMIMTVFLFI